MKNLCCLTIWACVASGAALAAPTLVSPSDTSERASSLSGRDAQSVYSAAEVGVTRRAYRAQCTKHQAADLCECLTAGYAQMLTPNEMRFAAAELRVRFARTDRSRADAQRALDRRAPAMGFPTADLRQVAADRIRALEVDLTATCSPPSP